ncbi:MAG: acyl-CoA dehydrogenase [Alphaproteobacteria bacterium]|nr:acyl-CoA dehydrogenase [Alphaproteobacteria bacterium]
MPSYRAPLRDMRFQLEEVLGIESLRNLPGFADAGGDLVAAVLGESAKIAEEVLLPLNQSGDREGCRFADGVVTTPAGFRAAFRTFAEGGWIGLSGDPDYGAQGLPYVLATAVSEMMISANMAFSTYPGLIAGAIEAISRHGSAAQKRTYLPRLFKGEWGGTMNLTEPHCGTDLGLLRTRAEPRADGSYAITGTKIFISAGEHDLTDNIIHLVLARIAGAPAGTRGISLFIVPKYLVNGDGTLGARNGVACGSIEHKMGLRASATCVMNYEDATGFLIGEANRGMRAMFTMMNAARIGVGLQGLALSEIAYQNAAAYARERRQGRALTGPAFPDQPADPIIVHPDVRRMLMTMRAFTEGGRALLLRTALAIDLAHKDADAEARRDAEDYAALLTPVVKATLTDLGFESVNLGLQCFGGAGYIRETGMEQFVRDARITQIYEGTSGIQALDLVGRKLPAHTGRYLRQFFHPLDRFLQDEMANPALKEFVSPLARAFARLQQVTAWIGEEGLKDPEQAGAAAADYLRLFGLVALGHAWAGMAKVAAERLASGTAEAPFYTAKLATARFFMAKMLPDTAALQARITAGAAPVMALAAEAF